MHFRQKKVAVRTIDDVQMAAIELRTSQNATCQSSGKTPKFSARVTASKSAMTGSVA